MSDLSPEVEAFVKKCQEDRGTKDLILRLADIIRAEDAKAELRPCIIDTARGLCRILGEGHDPDENETYDPAEWFPATTQEDLEKRKAFRNKYDKRRGLAGRLITIEGIDGTGKTTQIRMLAEWLAQNGVPHVVTKEPTEGHYGQEIRRIYTDHEKASPEQMSRLFMLDRWEHGPEIIASLVSNQTVIMDRYYYSNIAYQGAQGLDKKMIKADNEAFTPIPDLVIVLDIDVGTALKRVDKRGEKATSFEKKEFLNEVRNNFLSIAREDNRAILVDAYGTPEEVHARITDVIQECLMRGTGKSGFE